MYDLVVVGGGSGGLALSKRAACMYGKKVLLIDKTVLGGTCVNNGCIPKKMLYNAAAMHAEAKDLAREREGIKFNWNEFREKRSKYITFLNELYDKRNEKDGVQTITGTATVYEDRVEVDGIDYKGNNIVMAMGSYPVKINCPGKEILLSSDDFFKFKTIPKSVAIIGTGYISIETAFVLAEFGCQVTLIARRTGVLRSFDTLIQKKVQESLKSKGITLIENTTVSQIRTVDNKVLISLRSNSSSSNNIHSSDNMNSIHSSEVTVEKVICAIGRRASTEAIYIPEIEKKRDGFIETDCAFRTNKNNIYAIGDITMEEYMLTPVAIFSGRRLADYLFGNSTKNIKKLVASVPTVVFSHPPAGSVGYSEEESLKVSQSISVTTVTTHHQLSIFSNDKNSYKFVYDKETSELYGVHVHGYECDEVLQGYAVLVRNGIKYTEINLYLVSIGADHNELLSGVFE